MDDTPDSIARDIASISAISAVPSMLRIVCPTTGIQDTLSMKVSARRLDQMLRESRLA